MFNDLIYRLYPMMDEDGGAEGGAGTAPEPAGGNDDPEPMTFDEWLASNPEFQKEFDRRTTKGINTAVTKERARLNKLHDDQLTEAQRSVNYQNAPFYHVSAIGNRKNRPLKNRLERWNSSVFRRFSVWCTRCDSNTRRTV